MDGAFGGLTDSGRPWPRDWTAGPTGALHGWIARDLECGDSACGGLTGVDADTGIHVSFRVR